MIDLLVAEIRDLEDAVRRLAKERYYWAGRAFEAEARLEHLRLDGEAPGEKGKE